MEKITRYLIFLFLILSAVFAVRVITTQPLAPDSWLHMGMGKFIITYGRIPAHTDVSFKSVQPSLEWISHSWLSEILMHLTTVASEQLAPLITIPLLALCLFILFHIFRSLKLDKSIYFLAAAVVLVIAPSFWHFNPLVFAAPILMCMAYLYINYARYKHRRQILFMPLLLLLYANLWGGFIFIPVLFLTILFFYEVVLALVAAGKKNKGQRRLPVFAASYIASLIATLLNPYGLRIWIYFFTFVGIISQRIGFSTLAGVITVSSQSYFKSSLNIFFFVAYLAYVLFMGIAIAVLLIRDRTKFFSKISSTFPLFFFVVLGAAWIRFIPLGILGSLPLFGQIIAYLVAEKSNKVLSYVSVASLCLTTAFMIIFVVEPPSLYTPKFPKAQTDFASKNSLPDNMLTTHDLTGFVYYQLFPKKLLIDAQDDLFDEEEIHINVFDTATLIKEKEFNKIIKGNHINSAIVSKDLGDWAMTLNNHPEWTTYYLDYDGFVFAKTKATRSLDADQGLHHIYMMLAPGFEPKEATASAKSSVALRIDTRQILWRGDNSRAFTAT